MNRRIRQLAGGLMVRRPALHRPQLLAGRPPEAQRQVRQHAPSAASSSRRGPSSRSTASPSPHRSENPESSQFRYQRVYPTGELFGHITGYYVRLRLDWRQARENDVLTGGTARQQIRALPDIVTGRNRDDSGSVRLSLRSDLQEVAKEALGDRRGSVVVLEPKTGAIKAMWSYPASTQPRHQPGLRGGAPSSFLASRAIRCSPTPTSDGTCPARRSRC